MRNANWRPFSDHEGNSSEDGELFANPTTLDSPFMVSKSTISHLCVMGPCAEIEPSPDVFRITAMVFPSGDQFGYS